MLDMSRRDEFEAFLEWLLEQLAEEKPDALLVSGDIFDTTTPGERTRELYCEFLSRADAAGCRRIIITAGNHDGVAQLEVAKPLLQRHHCTVVTSLKRDEAEKCLIPIENESGEPVGLVCAVPFLRPGDVSLPQPEEERQYSYVRGVAAVYARVAELAEAWKSAHPGLPVVAMGHLPVLGAEATASTRSLYIGTLDVVGEEVFPPVFDYVALGHIHKPSADLTARVLYSGSPLSMGMDEANYEHRLLAVELAAGERRVRGIAVPQPVCYESVVCADPQELAQQVERLRQSPEQRIWLALEYHGCDLSTAELNTLLRRELPQERVPVIRAARVLPVTAAPRRRADLSVKLTDYTPEHIFRRALDKYIAETPQHESLRAELTELFHTVLSDIRNH